MVLNERWGCWESEEPSTTVGPNHPSNVAWVLNLRISYDCCYLLTKLARWTTINDRQLFLDFLVKSTNCYVTLTCVTKLGKTGFLVFESNLYHLKEHQKRNKTAKTAFRYETYGPNYGISKIFWCIPPDPWFSSIKDDCSGIIYSFIQNKLSFLVPQTLHCGLKSTVKISYMQPK